MQERLRVKSLKSDESLKLIGQSILLGDTVKNTFVNLSHIHGNGSEIEKHIISHYSEFLSLSSGNRWIDVTTFGDLYDGRYDRIEMNAAQPGIHEVHIIDGVTEIMNFMIIERDGDPIEVYFGWIQGATDQIEIFWSHEPKLLNLFESHFRNIRSAAVETTNINYSSKKMRLPSKSRDLVGTWITISIAQNIRSSDDYRRFSIMRIEVIEGKWHVFNTVYKKNMNNHRRESIIRSEVAQVFDGSIFFEYNRKTMTGDMQEEGFSTFKVTEFSNKVMSGNYVIGSRKNLVKSFAIKISDHYDREKVFEPEMINKKIDELLTIEELEILKSVE